MSKFRVSRNVSREECHWLDEDVPEGTTVYLYSGPTYGCVSGAGMAVSLEQDQTPFFELPRTALEEAK